MIRRNHGRSGLLPLAVLAGLLAGTGSSPAATFSLEYRTNRNSGTFTLPLKDTEVRFNKEPVYTGNKVARSVLYVAPGKKEFVGFACDLEGKKLYLDLNRNLDLTDDPDGVRDSLSDGWNRQFDNIAIPIQQGDRRREMVVDLQFYSESWGRYTVKSSWGVDEVVIGGRTWQVAVVDNGDGVIDRHDTLSLAPTGKGRDKRNEETPVEVQALASLTLDGEPFELSYEVSDDGKTLALSVEPGKEKLLDVELAGEGIERLVMQDPKSAAVCFGPASVIRLPAGRYRSNVRVRTGEGTNALRWEAYNVSCLVQKGRDQKPWVVGGPIVSKLTHTMTGSRITFNQAATGAGGEKYSLAGSSGKALGKPKLRVKKGGQVIHVGNFEYG